MLGACDDGAKDRDDDDPKPDGARLECERDSDGQWEVPL